MAAGIATPRSVKAASFCAFGVAGVAGLVLALATTPWLLVVGAACFAAGWFYSAGPRPYGYAGFGEIFVFVFFGLVAVIGTAYLSLGRITALAVVAAVPVGLLATALLVVNNLRDIDTDRRAGKNTLAVRIGAVVTRWLYTTCVMSAFALVVVIAFWRPVALVALLAVVPALPPVRRVLGGAEGRDLITALAGTGMLQLAFGVSSGPGDRPLSPAGKTRLPPGLEEIPHELDEGAGALEADGVARPGHDRQPGIGPDRVGRPLRKRPELVVERARPRPGPASRARRGVPKRGVWVPVPTVRSEAARPAAELARRDGRSACSSSRWAKSGPASHVSTNSATVASPPRSSSAARRSSSARRSRRLGSSEMPGCAPTMTRRSTRRGAWSAR